MSAVREQIRLVLTQTDGIPSYVSRSSRDRVLTTANMEQVGLAPPGSVELDCEPLVLLHLLYDSASYVEQGVFVTWLLEHLNDSTFAVITYFLIDLQHYDHLAELLKGTDEARIEVLRAIMLRLKGEAHLFSTGALDWIASLMCKLRMAKEEPHKRLQRHLASCITRLVDSVNYSRLARQLKEGCNPEINADQNRVFERAAGLGFSEALQKTLRSIDEKLLNASTKLDFKGCLDQTRIALEELVEESCRKVESKVGAPVPTGPKVHHYQPYIQYLKNAQLLLHDEEEALQKFYNLLSNEGSHSLEAEPEQAKVYKNIAVEWFLLITGRVQAFEMN